MLPAQRGVPRPPAPSPRSASLPEEGLLARPSWAVAEHGRQFRTSYRGRPYRGSPRPASALEKGTFPRSPQEASPIVSLSRLGSVPQLDWLRLVGNDPWCSSGLNTPPQASPVGEGHIRKQNWALLGRGRWKMGFLWSQSCPLHAGFHIFLCVKNCLRLSFVKLLEVEFCETARSWVFPQNYVCRITRLKLNFMIILVPSKNSRFLFFLSLFTPASHSLKATLKTFNPIALYWHQLPGSKSKISFNLLWESKPCWLCPQVSPRVASVNIKIHWTKLDEQIWLQPQWLFQETLVCLFGPWGMLLSSGEGVRLPPTVRIWLREKLYFRKTEISSGKISSLFEEFANPQRAFTSQGWRRICDVSPISHSPVSCLFAERNYPTEFHPMGDPSDTFLNFGPRKINIKISIILNSQPESISQRQKAEGPGGFLSSRPLSPGASRKSCLSLCPISCLPPSWAGTVSLLLVRRNKTPSPLLTEPFSTPGLASRVTVRTSALLLPCVSLPDSAPTPTAPLTKFCHELLESLPGPLTGREFSRAPVSASLPCLMSSSHDQCTTRRMQHEKDTVSASRPCSPGALERHRWVKVMDVPGGQFDLCLLDSCHCQGEGLAGGLKARGRKGRMEREAGPGGEKARARNRRKVLPGFHRKPCLRICAPGSHLDVRLGPSLLPGSSLPPSLLSCGCEVLSGL